MTAAFLQSELANLVTDSKRKYADVKGAAERSSNDLKAITVTSEKQLAADLCRKPQFIEPFLLACKSENVKLAGSGAACLQRLIASSAIPRSRILDVLSAFQDAVPLALEVQLKILQTLPSLLQLYASDLHGESLAITLGISAELSGSKLSVVGNTAAATFQQLVAAVFEQISVDKEQATAREASNGNGTVDNVKDATLLFGDLCALLTGGQPAFVRLNGLAPALVLEAIENLLSSNSLEAIGAEGLHEVCEKSLVPGLMKLVKESNSFGAVARALRITFILSTHYLELLSKVLENIFIVILTALDRSSGARWKRVLCLEFSRGLCSDFEALKSVFAAYDQSESSRHIVSQLMAVLVRIASEDPSLIGLGRQSTIPVNQAVETTSDAVGAVDLPGTSTTLGNVAQAGSGSTGISIEWSTTATPCLDQFDRASPPEIPETYIYTLVLGCVSALSDGLSKFIMPLSVPSRKMGKADELDNEYDVAVTDRPKVSNHRASAAQKYQQLVNPLTKTDSDRLPEVQMCSDIIEECWPAVLAICSTFLNAALDSYFYHILVRTVQKLAQVSGVLELITPRDALLTTLAKVSVPINVSRLMNHFYGNKAVKMETEPGSEVNSPTNTIPDTPSQSFDMSRQSLNVRNLLCLRALLNLGIALGPTLSSSAWMIIFQSQQQVEALMSVGPFPSSSTGGDQPHGDVVSHTNLASEIGSVETATKRMLESTKHYSSSAFGTIIEAVFQMAEDIFPLEQGKIGASLSPHDQAASHLQATRHKSNRSVSGSWTKAALLEVEVQFVLKVLAKLAFTNIARFSSTESAATTWELIASKLLTVQQNDSLSNNIRLLAADVLDTLVTKCANSPQESEGTAAVVQGHALPYLQRQLRHFVERSEDTKSFVLRMEMRQKVLDALENVVGQCGDLFHEGWLDVFEILRETVEQISADKVKNDQMDDTNSNLTLQQKTITAAFRCVQLIVSDFLQSLDNPALAKLVELLGSFGGQRFDLNMCLTATALYWNLMTLLLERTADNEKQQFDIHPQPKGSLNTENLSTQQLWYQTTLSLAQLCGDNRSDVRTAAVRMLLRALDASGKHLTSQSLTTCIKTILVPLMESCTQHYSKSDASWLESLLQLLEGATLWIEVNATSIVQSTSFDHMWEKYCGALQHVLDLHELSSTGAVYSALSATISAFNSQKEIVPTTSEEFSGRLAWQLWYQYHPADIGLENQSNEKALAAHAQVLAELAQFSFSTIQSSCDEVEENPIVTSVLRAISVARHTRYSNDTNHLSIEQQGMFQNIIILRRVREARSARKQFCQEFTSILSAIRTSAEETAHLGPTVDCPKGLQRPTFSALLSECLDFFKDFIIEISDSGSFARDMSIAPILDLLSSVALKSRQQSLITESTSKPVRRNASSAAVELILATKRNIDSFPQNTFTNLGPALVASVESLITSDMLDNYSSKPSAETLLAYEAVDIELFNRAHTAAQPILQHADFSNAWRKQYVVTLFHASLAKKPWFGDFPKDLLNHPLEGFNKIRPGSLKAPDLPPRSTVYVEAFNALVQLTSQSDARGGPTDGGPSLLATTAAPYVLLRIAHPLKVFMSDQRLRHLTPPHPVLLKELQLVLNKAVDLHSDSRAFHDTPGVSEAALMDDGQAHLRILYPLIVKFEEFWTNLPKLDICAWQDTEEGREIRKALHDWKKHLSQGWEIV